MNGFHDAAYNMAAVIATLALCRALIEKGIERMQCKCCSTKR